MLHEHILSLVCAFFITKVFERIAYSFIFALAQLVLRRFPSVTRLFLVTNGKEESVLSPLGEHRTNTQLKGRPVDVQGQLGCGCPMVRSWVGTLVLWCLHTGSSLLPFLCYARVRVFHCLGLLAASRRNVDSKTRCGVTTTTVQSFFTPFKGGTFCAHIVFFSHGFPPTPENM